MKRLVANHTNSKFYSLVRDTAIENGFVILPGDEEEIIRLISSTYGYIATRRKEVLWLQIKKVSKVYDETS